ncbi:MAG TPA: GAF domain-containing protein, partial [Verrucomicrobiae bacterium]|nr:GAF domain-containing protein [Verrucomicrobiae bacterium]
MRSRSAAVVPPPLASAARELAILGLEFDARAAEVALGLDATATSAILSGLRLGGCITEVPAGPGDARWRFAIPGLSDSLVAKMAASRRRLLHRRVLAHFQALKGASRDPVALATHLAGSGDPASSAGIHRELGNRAFNDHDFLRACEHLEQAFLFLDGARGDGAGVVRFELAKALQSAGRSEASRSHLQQLIDERGSGVDAVDLRIAQAWNLNELGRPDDALALIQEALGLVSEGDRTRRGLLHEQMGWIEYVRRDFASAERHVDAAREAAGTEAAPRVLARIESLRGRLLGERGESLEAEKSLLRAAEMFRLLGDGWRLQTELHTLGLTLKRTDPERAREFLIRARDECARVGDDRGLVVALCNLANVDLALGAWDAAAAAYRLAIDIGESLSVASLDHPYASFGYLLTDQGRFDEALTCFDRASHIAASRRSVRVLPTIEVRRARLEMRRGHPELALKVLDGIAPSISPSERNDWVLLHLYRARALAELGRFADAELSANAATSAATTHGDETLRGEALLHCAVVDRLGGRRDVALKKLEAALAIFRHNRQRPYEARALLERAETLAPEGARVKEALADVEWAIANFERTGAAPFLERATKLRARLVRDSERRKEAPRELETLYRVGRLLEVGVDLPSLLEDLLDAAISLVGAERGMIFLVPAEGSNELVRAASRALDESEARDVERTSRGILKRALTDDSPLLSPDAKEDSRLRSLKSVIRFEIRSVLCAPLRTAKSVLGTIYLDHRIPARFGEKEAEFIRALAGLAAPAIAAAAARRSLDTEVRGLRQEVQSLRTRDGDGMAPEVIVGASASMRRVRDLVERCAASDANVLI